MLPQSRDHVRLETDEKHAVRRRLGFGRHHFGQLGKNFRSAFDFHVNLEPVARQRQRFGQRRQTLAGKPRALPRARVQRPQLRQGRVGDCQVSVCRPLGRTIVQTDDLVILCQIDVALEAVRPPRLIAERYAAIVFSGASSDSPRCETKRTTLPHPHACVPQQSIDPIKKVPSRQIRVSSCH